jgi:hypothetical protein
MAQEPILTLEAIRERRQALRRQLADLDAAERVLLSLRPPPNAASRNNGLLRSAPVTDMLPEDAPPEGKRLIKHRILELVGQSDHGLTSQMVLDGLRASIPDYKGHNVSPKLSDYKGQGWLTLDQGLWKITEEGRKEYLKSND